ncbi:MAG: LCP family protein [bacterium]|nr:LCP family protein [bacterium]
MSKRKRNRPNIFSIIIWIGAFISLSLLSYQIYKANILPMKYFMILVGVIVFMILLFFIFVKNRRVKTWVLVFLNIIFIIMISGCLFASYKINDLMNFLNDNLGAKYETNIYYILVNKDSIYKNTSDINGKLVKLVDDIGDKETLENSIKKVVKVNFGYVDNISTLLKELETDKELIIVVNSGNYDAMIENDQLLQNKVLYSDKVRILETIEIKSKLVNSNIDFDIIEKPFVVYLSGIDTRSGKLPSRSLSDVNMIIAVNPKTHNILLLNTPRDYFVELHGITGSKDKLTHAGIIGGYTLSMQTLEDLYGIDIHYFVRVNFNAVTRLVNAIGGITVDSDVNYSFRCVANPTCVIKPGSNTLNGDCALAFARERKAYITGDRHRGENQQQVISKVIEKVTSSTTLLKKSSEILNALTGTFETNVTTDEITSLVKEQLNNMQGWNISTYSVTGSDLYSTTYSYPNNELYVMLPDENTVNEAKVKLNNILENNQ